jgi:hypothetical protein
MSRTKLALGAAAVAAALAVPSSASAANPYTGQQICGAGYSLAKSYPLRSNDGAVLLGTLQVLQKTAGTNRSCGVLLKERQIGVATYTSVNIARYRNDPANVNWVGDSGNFMYYAGPVYVDCLAAGTRIGGYMSVPGGREGQWVEPAWSGGC